MYFQHTSTASAEQITVTGSKVLPDITPGPDTIYGYVKDKNLNGISGATVTIYNVNVVDSYPLSDGLVDIAGNPTMTASDSFAGFYAFEGLQPGLYNVTAEIEGHMWFAIVNMTGSDASGVEHNVAIPDYVNPA
jgi:hypothetical protein